MKKILVSLLACAMVLSFAACSKKDDANTSSSSSDVSSSDVTSSSSEVSSDAPIAPEADPKEKEFYDAEAKKVEDAIKAGLTSGTPAEKVEGMDDKLQASYEEVKKVLGENYIPSAPIDALQLKEVYGIDSASVANVIAEGPMISTHVDTFIAVKAVEGKGEEIEKALNTYRDALLADTMQYPMNLPKIASSKVIRDGDYVYFAMVSGFYEAE
ncbi:MAG: DUF4358 domain-containing protein [Oscillospiraceae bacterium]